MSLRKVNRPAWLRYSGIGIEFAAAVGGFAAIGIWFDKHYDSSPWGVLVGLLLGLIGGTYNLIREALYAVRKEQKDTPADLFSEKKNHP